MNQMSMVNEMKKLLGDRYSFKQLVSNEEAGHMKCAQPQNFSEQTVAFLSAGCLGISAVLYPAGGEVQLGYDIFVKDDPDSAEWICYDNLPEQDGFEEEKLLSVLDGIARENGLSYTECSFTRLEGKEIEQEDKTQAFAL